MGGTVRGGLKAAATNKARHGKDFYKKLGRRGGKKGKADGVIKGFAANRELARSAGALGGRISRKGPKIANLDKLTPEVMQEALATRPF